MPLPEPIAQLQRRLIELGCPLKAVRNIVRETADHYEDLEKAALAEGFPAMESAVRASELLGDPQQLAERHVEAIQNSSKWGRYPFFLFGVAPVMVVLDLWLLYIISNNGQIPIAVLREFLTIKSPKVFLLIYFASYAIGMVVTMLVAAFFCSRARRFAVESRWYWAIGSLLFAHGLFFRIQPSADMAVILAHPIQIVVPDGELDTVRGTSSLRSQIWMYTLSAEFKQREALVTKPSLWDSDWKIASAVSPHGTWFPNGQYYSRRTNVTVSGIPGNMYKSWMLAGWTGQENPSGNVSIQGEGLMRFPMPHIYCSYSFADLNGFLNWINVALPLLIVAAMLYWQRRAENQAFA